MDAQWQQIVGPTTASRTEQALHDDDDDDDDARTGIFSNSVPPKSEMDMVATAKSWRVSYTAQKCRKRPIWQDGVLKVLDFRKVRAAVHCG